MKYLIDGLLDYYVEGLDNQGRWQGQGATKLGLHGRVDRIAFYNVLEGRSPDGKHNLVQNAGHEHRQCYWDLVFSPPKSVSVLWVMLPEHLREQIVQAHNESVQETLAFMEQEAGFTRRGKGGTIIERVPLAFATFLHGTSRAHDPLVHTHCALINLCVREDGSTGSLRTEEIFDHKIAGGERYLLGLAARLHQRLGLTVEPDRVGFRIVGVPQKLCRTLSKRRQKIEQVMAERGVQGAVAAREIAEQTRPRKQKLPAAVLFSQCQELGRSMGWSTEQAVALVRGPRQQTHCAAADSDQALRPVPSKRKTGHENNPDSSLPATSSAKAAKDRARSRAERRAANRQAFQEAIDRILADYYVPPPSDQNAVPEQTPSHTRDEANRLGKSLGEEKKRRFSDEHQERANTGAPRGHETESDPRTERSSNQERENQSWSQGNAGPGRPSHSTTNEQRKDAHATEREMKKKIREFTRAYLAMLDRMHPETQSRERLEKLAWWLSNQMGVDAVAVKNLLKEIIPGQESTVLHWELRRIFPKAYWKWARELRLNVLCLGNPPRHWTETRWKKEWGRFELRLQERRLFPHAPRWNPLHGLQFPALRLRRKPADLIPVKPASEPDQERQNRQGRTR